MYVELKAVINVFRYVLKILDVKHIEDRVYKVKDMVEKPNEDGTYKTFACSDTNHLDAYLYIVEEKER